ncbi:hypothetical protein [Salicibibacter kimchii]|uniref:Transposase (putative) YhgA-like domain-containing protein n=1 Tax=Salicibibacter kimchii TaxID=2099786 RepID=A0A345C2C8_9BACI|nr:hypothetical protein [Salicibibacter kimchii]AXF57359.1 hypothetical protein DT065_16075 [Salicibibacter kimchii]
MLQEFFEEFIVLFFPNIYEEIDFAHLNFLDKELFNDVQRRKSKEVDMAVETKLKGEGSLILIHLEQQAQYEDDFNERMFLAGKYKAFTCISATKASAINAWRKPSLLIF